jgi:hypothetical protein
VKASGEWSAISVNRKGGHPSLGVYDLRDGRLRKFDSNASVDTRTLRHPAWENAPTTAGAWKGSDSVGFARSMMNHAVGTRNRVTKKA